MGWSTVDRLDARLDTAFGRWRGNPVADRVAYVASALGDHGLIWFLIGLVRSRRPGRRRNGAVWAIAFTGVVGPVVNAAVKRAVGRVRPDPRADDPPSIRAPRSASFPSGHALAAWCAASLLAEDDPLGSVYMAVAGTVTLSRVHLRQHHGTDVLAGAGLGIILGRLGNRLVRPYRSKWPR